MAVAVITQFLIDNEIEYTENYSLKSKNTYKTGGNAKVFACPDNQEKTEKLIMEIAELRKK